MLIWFKIVLAKFNMDKKAKNLMLIFDFVEKGLKNSCKKLSRKRWKKKVSDCVQKVSACNFLVWIFLQVKCRWKAQSKNIVYKFITSISFCIHLQSGRFHFEQKRSQSVCPSEHPVQSEGKIRTHRIEISYYDCLYKFTSKHKPVLPSPF